jgi:hypothetical protein
MDGKEWPAAAAKEVDKSTLNKLIDSRNAIFLKNVKREFATVRGCESALRSAKSEIQKAVRKFSIKQKQVREPLFQGSVDLALQDLKQAEEIVSKAFEKFSISMNRTKKFANGLHAERKGLRGGPNEDLQILSDYFGGYLKLHIEFQRTPNLVPPGVNPKISADGIRKRLATVAKKRRPTSDSFSKKRKKR